MARILARFATGPAADVRIEVRRGRIARREVEKQEDERDDAEQDRHRLRQPAKREPDQVGLTPQAVRSEATSRGPLFIL